MDFHSLSRKDLQTLCKKNSIRANLTNAAMADALKALDSVEGLEDIQLTTAPKTEEVLPESPEKTAARSMGPPRTCGRTSTRRKAIQDSADLMGNKSKDVEESMRRPRTGRGMAAKSSAARRICKEEEEKEEEEENMLESLAENNRLEPLKTPVTRNGRKKGMAIALVKKLEKEAQHDVPEILAEKNRSEAPKTPRTRDGRKKAMANSSARSNVETENKEGKENVDPTTVGSRIYSTRRSSRLLAKSLQEEASLIQKSRGKKETVKIAALLEESEDPEKEIKDGFERSDLEEEGEQGDFINQFTRKDGQVLTAVNQNLVLNDAIANIPEEDASRDNQTAVLEYPTSPESCILESRKSKAEDSVHSSLVENHALEAPSPCRKSLDEDSSASSLMENEMPACSDGATADTPEEDASGGKQAAVLDSSASPEFCVQEKSVDEDSIDSSLVEKQMLEFTEYAVANVSEEDASGSNRTAVLESLSSPESFIQESRESVDEDSIDSSFMENQLLKCSKDAIADIPKEDASGGNRTAVLESPPPESCIEENRSSPEEDSIDSSFVENQMLKHEESEPDPDAGGDTDLDLDLKMIASGTSGKVSDEILVGSTTTENLMVENENCDLYADDDDLLHPKDAVDQVSKEVLIEIPVDVVEIPSEVSYEIVVESITAENLEECENCNLDEADQVPSDVVIKDPVDTDENEADQMKMMQPCLEDEADQIPTNVPNEMLGDLDQVPGEDDIQIENTAEVPKPQSAKCDPDAVDDPDLHLIEVADQVPADMVAEISVNEDAKISCDGCLTEEMESLVLLFAENLTLKSEKCIPLSISDPDQEKDTDGKISDETVTENQLLESEICRPGAPQDRKLKTSDVEISVEDDESGEGITDRSSENSILDSENCHTDANTGLILGLEIVSDLLSNEVSLKTASSSSSSGTNMIENPVGIEDSADDSVTSLDLGQKNATDALSDGSSLDKPAWSVDSATDHCKTDADAGIDLVLENVAAGIESTEGLDLGQKNVIDALSDESTLEKPAQSINSDTDHCKPDADADLDLVLENVTDLALDEVSPMTTIESGTSSTVVATNTAESEENANDKDHSILENSKEGCEKASPDATLVQYLQKNPEISATEISSELLTGNGILSTPASLRSKRVEAPGSAKSWGYKSSKALRLSLSAKKVTPMRNKITMEETDKENKNVGLGSGKRERKEFRSMTKVRMVVIEGEDSRQKSLKKKSLRQLKGMLKEKMREKNEKRSALHVLSDNCSLGKGVNGET